MTIDCKRCGGLTLPETLITLRRSFLGLRATRATAEYCPACKVSVPVDTAVAMRPVTAPISVGGRPPIATRRRPRHRLGEFWLLGSRLAPARSGDVKWV